jgi:rRNA maturation RNase YbeY
MSISFEFQSQYDLNINLEKIEYWIEKVVDYFDYEIGEINYVFCNDEYILEVNKEYLEHDYYTDIISFDACMGDIISGDIVLSIDTVKSNSEKFETEFISELKRVIIHGVLHFIGFKDKTDKEQRIMTTMENQMLELYDKI